MEIEIKLNVKPAIPGGPVMLFTKLTMQSQLAGLPLGGISKAEIRDLYYDTEDLVLAKAGAGLRFRRIDEKPYVTLKINRFHEGALTRREEFEEPLSQERLDWVLSHVRDLVGEGPFPVEDFAAGRGCGNLKPVLAVGTARIVRPIGTMAELVMDMVEYPGLSAQAFFDIEVEAVGGKGGEHIIRRVEDELYLMAEGYIAPARMSKLERGLRMKEKARA